jgi:hypothetical protein
LTVPSTVRSPAVMRILSPFFRCAKTHLPLLVGKRKLHPCATCQSGRGIRKKAAP